MGATQWCIWLMHRAKSRKVVVSIPVGFIGIFHGLDRSEYQEYFVGGQGGRCMRLTTLPPSFADSRNLGASASWKLPGM